MRHELKKYSVPVSGDMPENKENGTRIVLYCQLKSTLTIIICQIRIGGVQKKEKYTIDVDLFAELGYNSKTTSENIVSWF